MRAKGLLWATVLEMELAQATGSAMGQLKEQLKEKARGQLWVLQMGQLKEQLKVRLTVLVWEMLSVLVWALQSD